MGRLRNSLPDVDIVETEQISWQILSQADALFFQRPVLDEHAKLIELARMNRKGVWLDYDDDVFNVPPTNPHYPKYKNIGPQIEACVRQADVITLSTEALLFAFQERVAKWERKPEFHVIPNAWDERLFPYEAFDPKPVVVWRGSGTHDDDLASCGQQIAELTYECKGVKFVFMGQPNYAVTKRCKPESIEIVAPLDPVRYMLKLRSLSPKVVMVPLRDNALNRSKSYIAWLEATYAGAVCVAPAWPEWNRPGVLGYHTPPDFKARVKEALAIDTREDVNLSRMFVQDNCCLGLVNKMRAEIAHRLCTHSA